MSSDHLPTPAHVQADSMLARKFGKETVNYFGGSPLNRLSFLRTDYPFLSAAVKHPSSRFILLDNLSPLVKSPSALFHAQHSDVQSLLPTSWFDLPEEDLIRDFDSRITRPDLVFLGIDESAAESGAKDEDLLQWKIYKGRPYFALDVSEKGNEEQKATARALVETLKQKGVTPYLSRIHMTLLPDEGAIYAQARAYLDWNNRNKFCGTCGYPTLSVNAGTKRTCPPTDKAYAAEGKNPEKPPCSTRTTLSNLSFPRTDPTIIVATLSVDGKRLLLGRSKRFPPHWYSTLAGFIEPGESVEDAVRREVWEEAGVTLSRVVIHSTQPWPYPANLMIGAIAQVSDPAHETINLAHDPELEDAKWFTIAEVEEALRNGTSALGEPASKNYIEGNLRLPPPTAIANQLIQAAVSKEYVGDKLARM
ncbi:putative NADH pyrophosphatase [Talaromyces proteolyticus]|uniref:NAD(+) diphosphatase n=1 Tax=Talaromyces proteolyticus TaxID=1131652 RepID=A0AAD4PZ10_9EURO|nr:putative NADH pyrophosphatase [Talaromyces proteolyticus]KAH8702125.1 putative NADH pyrophosphatase [Talaromyces proteolyticus]